MPPEVSPAYASAEPSKSVVIDDVVAFDHFVSEHIAQFGVRVGAMGSGRHHDDDVAVGQVGKLAQQYGQDGRAGHRTGDVAHRYDDGCGRASPAFAEASLCPPGRVSPS